ncbi:reticulon-like protein B13 [Pyrus x bretschneideri]|uniref:reticulon-like protein B13 n=1 Tax=Pyrus x bretschneideri TaxID=225117 RepID=UPI00202F2246|nr:reticulon-like protein B13 [Pyrus x bretschneideri]
MAATSQSSDSSLPKLDTVRDILLWRKKKQSFLVLFTATATWILLDVYQFNFLTVISYVAMFIVTSLFLSGNLLRLLGKEPPDLSRVGITEKSALEMGNTVRAWVEEGIRWMFQVAAEREWFVFVGTVSGLWLLSGVARCVDLLTLLYIGTVMGMTAPAMYVKYEDKIERSEEKLKAQLKRYYDTLDEKVVKKIQNKVTVGEKKVKKVE